MKMKVNQTTQSCLFWATLLLCISYLASANDEDLMDFDFTDLKEIDWNYDINGSNETTGTTTADDNWRGQGHGHGALTFDDDDMSENQVHPFDWREKILRTALSKALTNKSLRQKFVEVMPILRVLSKQQRLALSALISAQVNAKKGQELKLEQVRMMFGDDKKLLIPIVYDIARLVGDSARKYLQFSYELLPMAHQQKQQAQRRLQQQHQKLPPMNRRKFDLDAVEELSEDGDDVGTLPSAAMPAALSAVENSLEDFFGEIPDDVLDPQSINEALQASAEKSKAKANLQQTTAKTKRSLQYRRSRREAQNAGAKEFVHKLIRSIPLSVNEEDLQKGAAGRTVKLNTTSFVLPNANELPQKPNMMMTTAPTATTKIATNADPTSTAQLPSYQEIEDLAFASLNGSEIHLEGNTEISEPQNEPLPSPEELIAGPRYRINNNKVRIIRPKLPPAVAKRKRVQVLQQQPQQSRPYIRPKGVLPSGPQTAAALVPAPRKCERFTASMCIRTDDYPLDQIMGSIRRHKNAMTALLAEFHDKPLNLDFSDEFDEFGYNKRRREDEGGAAGSSSGSSSSSSGGSMCQSIVRYARPQKARSASGEWKYIVNTGQHTQTLRLEKCSNPQESCSYLAQNYRSHCAQVYNYHRLLSWDKTRGLHVDIFKVPTCCSCQIDGYRQQFPPLDTIKSKEFTPAYSPEPYSTINEELDYNDDEDEDDLSFQYAHNYHHHKKDNSRHAYENQATNELQLGSQSVRTKVHAPNPTVGSYLTPPGSNEYDVNYAYKGSGSNHHQYHQQQHPHHHRTAVTASVTTSSKSAYSHLPRRRPYKSLGHSFDGESRADLEIAPSEVHTDKEVNIYGNDKTRQVQQQKRKRIYSVPHTATTSSLGSSSSSSGGDNIPIITSAGISTSSVPPHGLGSGYGGHGHGYGYGPNSHNGNGEHGKTGGAPAITTITTTHQTSAASPSYYTPGAGKNVIRSGSGNYGKSKPRYRVTQPTPNAQTQRTAYASAIAPSSASSTPVSASSASLPATERGPQYATTPASSDAAFPSIYHISSIFNNSVPIGGTKRINYSYHPIIDFFENSSNKRKATTRTAQAAASATTTTSTHTAAGEREHGGTRTTFSVHDQIISHKIPKYSSVINKKLPATAVSTAVDVNGLLQYRERRIGMGAGSVAVDDVGVGSDSGGGGAGASAGTGNGVGFGFGYGVVDSNASQGDDIVTGNDIRTSAGAEDNVWHPMLVQ